MADDEDIDGDAWLARLDRIVTEASSVLESEGSRVAETPPKLEARRTLAGVGEPGGAARKSYEPANIRGGPLVEMATGSFGGH